MKISYNWLKDYIDIDLPPDELGDILTNIGLEVEGMETFEPVKGSMVSDTVFEIGLTPNRIDGASHYGVARDLKAFLNQGGRAKLKMPPADGFSIDNEDLKIGIRIENLEACKRYAGVTLSGISVKESPKWLKNRLLSVGLSPINNIVDISNYVLYELGQPLHAFDADHIKEHTIVVRTLPEGTRFVTLDEVERTLSADDLIICDGKDGMCIGGVFGGIHSGVTEKTRNVFLESAYFDPVFIRRTSKRHGLNTDASFRFERGADPEMTLPALKRAAMLIKEIAGGSISSGIVDVYPAKLEPFRVNVNYSHVDRLVGKKIDRKVIKKILESLEIKIESEDPGGIRVSVPRYRVDVQREADVIEEILRIYGYNNVGFMERMTSRVTHAEKPDKEKLTQIVSDHLSSNGFNEIMCNSLTREAYYNDDPGAVELLNPLSTDLNRMRTTLLYGGLETILYNVNRKRSNLRLYEFGNCYRLAVESDPDILDTYEEQERLSMLITGNRVEGNWIEKDQPGTFYELKTYVEHVFNRLGIATAGLDTREVESGDFKDGMGFWHKEKKLVEMGPVSAALLKSFGISSDVFYAEFKWDHVMEALRDVKITLDPIPRFPEVRRDLSMIIDRSIEFSQIRDIALRTEKKLLKSIHLFDVYESENLGKGEKSYAVGFVLQNPEKTLTDKEIDRIMDRIQANLEKKVNARIRQSTA